MVPSLGPKPRRGVVTLERSTTLLLAAASLFSCGCCVVLLCSFAPFSPLCGPGCLETRLKAMVGANGEVETGKIDEARTLIRRELRFSPMDIPAWLRQAALESQVAGKLSGPARAALSASYRWAPVDASVARWRLAFMFEHWDQLDPQLRDDAMTELQGLLIQPANIEILRQLEPTIRNPAGRLACRLLIASALRSGPTTGG